MKNGLFLLVMASSAPAMAAHVYANYECSNAELKLNYDGPGSNYAFGGFSHFYSKTDSSKQSVLAVESGNDDTIGEDVGDKLLETIFNIAVSERTSEVSNSLKAGDKCTPNEMDYQHSEWTTHKNVTVIDASPSATEKLGLLQGQEIEMNCAETQDVPVVCPESGQYGPDDL